MVTLYLIIIMYIFIYATTMNFLDFGPVLYNNLIVSLINKYLKDRIKKRPIQVLIYPKKDRHSLVALVNLLIYESFMGFIFIYFYY